MRVALDTSVVLPAMLSLGLRRNLLILLVYGRLAEYARVGELELEELNRLAAEGAQLGGPDPMGFVEQAAQRKARLEEHLPERAPDDLALVGSEQLLDEYENKLLEKGPGIARIDISPADAVEMRRELAASMMVIIPALDAETIPHYTEGRDRDDDIVIHTALEARADALIADDKHISVDRDGITEYSDPAGERVVPAMTFATFVERQWGTSLFELGAVEPGLLALALGRASSED